MKRIYQLAAVLAMVFVVPAVVSTSALAAYTCEIGYTGPDSNNICVSKEQFTCEVTNTNNVSIRNSEEQEVASGTVSVEDNGTGGGAVSGSASNSSNTTFNVVINNGTEKPCLVSAVVPATEVPEQPTQPTQPVQPEQVTPGRGEAYAPVRPAQQVTPAALPVTSGNTAPVLFLTSGAIATAALAAAYRRLY